MSHVYTWDKQKIKQRQKVKLYNLSASTALNCKRMRVQKWIFHPWQQLLPTRQQKKGQNYWPWWRASMTCGYLVTTRNISSGTLLALLAFLCGLIFLSVTIWLEDVSLECKLAEEVEIRGIHKSARDEIGAVVVASTVVQQIVPAGDAHTCTNKHLQNLSKCDKHWGKPLRASVQRLQAIVAVHHRVHSEVHGNEVQTAAGHCGVCAPTKHENGNVVVPV